MNIYIAEIWLTFCGGFVAGWVSLIVLVWTIAAMQRRRNRRPQ